MELVRDGQDGLLGFEKGISRYTIRRMLAFRLPGRQYLGIVHDSRPN